MTGCPVDTVAIHAGVDVYNLWRTGEYAVRPFLVDPSWSGWGGDAFASTPVWRCVRVGVREKVTIARQTDMVGILGRRDHFVTSFGVGAERELGWGFEVGGYLLPGLRIVSVHDEVAFDAVSTDYRHVTVLPTLSALSVVRWWALPGLGLHVDLGFPVADVPRALNFADQFLGIGVDVRWRGQTGALSRPGGTTTSGK